MELCGGGELEEGLHAQVALDTPNPFPPKVPRYVQHAAVMKGNAPPLRFVRVAA